MTGEGPREQTEKSGRVHQERPSLVWHGLGPARESTTTPHRSVEPRWSRGGGAARTVTRGARFKPHRQPPPPPPRLRRERPTTPGRERLTRGTEPIGQGSHLSLHRVPAAGSAQGRRPTAPRPATLGSPRDRRWHHGSGQLDTTTTTAREPAHRPRRAAPAARAEPGTSWRPEGSEPRVHLETQSPRRQTPKETVSALTWW